MICESCSALSDIFLTDQEGMLKCKDHFPENRCPAFADSFAHHSLTGDICNFVYTDVMRCIKGSVFGSQGHQ